MNWRAGHNPRSMFSRDISFKRTLLLLLLSLMAPLVGQKIGFTQAKSLNYDENKVGAYTLPDPLTLENGRKVKTAAAWYRERRPQLLREFGTQMFGLTPSGHVRIHPLKTEIDPSALDGIAIREQVTLDVIGRGLTRHLHLLLYLPAKARGPVPVFLGLNFNGNHTVSGDPGITLNAVWAHPPKSLAFRIYTAKAGYPGLV